MKTVLAFAAAFVLAASPALAQDAGGEDSDRRVSDQALTGRWSFQAEAFFGFDVTQEIGGEMELTLDADGEFTCSLLVYDRIPEHEVTIVTEQSCVATWEGDELRIVSTVLSVDPPTYNYVPDNFTLTVISGDRMEGVLHAGDGVLTPAAVFTRGGALLS